MRCRTPQALRGLSCFLVGLPTEISAKPAESRLHLAPGGQAEACLKLQGFSRLPRPGLGGLSTAALSRERVTTGLCHPARSPLGEIRGQAGGGNSYTGRSCGSCGRRLHKHTLVSGSLRSSALGAHHLFTDACANSRHQEWFFFFFCLSFEILWKEIGKWREGSKWKGEKPGLEAEKTHESRGWGRQGRQFWPRRPKRRFGPG